MKKLKKFFKGVKKETKMTHWPTGKELLKYSLVSIFMIAFFAGFFYLLDLLFAFLRGLV